MERKTEALLRLSVLIALLGGIAAWTPAQTPGTMEADLQSALEKAQAAAYRPGDESLGCEALETELVAVARDSAVQSHVAKWGAEAQRKMAAMNAAAAGAAGASAVTFFSSVLPGGGWAAQAAGAAQLPAQRAQAAHNIEQAMQQAREMMGIMPQMMRGQRVIELARSRDCPWVREGEGR
jgi:hypothetical protein